MVLLQKDQMPYGPVLAIFQDSYNRQKITATKLISIFFAVTLTVSFGSDIFSFGVKELLYPSILPKNLSKLLSPHVPLPTYPTKINLVILEKVFFHTPNSAESSKQDE